MKDSTYWEDRQKQLWEQLEKDEAVLNEKLANLYAGEAEKLEKEIAKFYQKYGKDNVLKYSDMMKDLGTEDFNLLMRNMDDFFLKYPQYADLQDVRKYVYQLNRLEGLQQSIYLQQLQIGALEQDLIEKHLARQIERAYNVILAGNGKAFNTFNSNIVKQVLNQKWVNAKNFSDRIWDNKKALTEYLNKEFAVSLARGDSYQKMINALKEKFADLSTSNASRLVYTEGTFMLNESMMLAFEEDYEEYDYSAVLDNKTSKLCREMNKKRFKIKERSAGVNFPPMHPRCRSGFTIVIPNEEELDN